VVHNVLEEQSGFWSETGALPFDLTCADYVALDDSIFWITNSWAQR
jgi:hypothetical protein